MRQKVLSGLDRVVAKPERFIGPATTRVGFLGHPASVTRSFEHGIDALLARGVRLERLFGPEHGLRGEAQYMEAVGSEVDPLTGLPSVSLYGATLEQLTPTAADLAGLDVVLVDLQDVGSRYYTYVYTALFMAQACARAGVRCLLLDRPNPLGGAVEGPTVGERFRSFVGWLPLPTRHGLTPGEVLAFAAAAGFAHNAEVVPCDGWHRGLWMDEHDAPWVLPSPNMPTLDTAVVYPGMCLLEGTNISEGRGTTRPFEIFGAPYINAHELGRVLADLQLPGVAFRACAYVPTFDKFRGQRCYGLQQHITDREAYRPLLTGAAILWAVARLYPAHFAWRADAYEFVDDVPAIDLLFGSELPRGCIERSEPFAALAALLATPADLNAAVSAARLTVYNAP